MLSEFRQRIVSSDEARAKELNEYINERIGQMKDEDVRTSLGQMSEYAIESQQKETTKTPKKLSSDVVLANENRLRSLLGYSLHPESDFIASKTYLRDACQISKDDPDVGIAFGNMILELTKDRYDCKKYSDTVHFLLKSKAKGKKPANSELSILLDPDNVNDIKTHLNDIFMSYIRGDNKSWEWSGLDDKSGAIPMMQGMKSDGARLQNFKSELEMIGRQSAWDSVTKEWRDYSGEIPEYYFDCGCGSGEKGIKRCEFPLKSGRQVNLVQIDSSKGMIDEARMNAERELPRFAKRARTKYKVTSINDKFENLRDNEEFQKLAKSNVKKSVFMWYSGAFNYSPPESVDIFSKVVPFGGYAEISFNLHKGDLNDVIDLFKSKSSEDVSAVRLKGLGFLPKQIKSMDFRVELVQSKEEMPKVITYYVPRKKMRARLTEVGPRDRIFSAFRYIYTDEEQPANFFNTRFEILNRFKKPQRKSVDIIYQMRKR